MFGSSSDPTRRGGNGAAAAAAARTLLGRAFGTSNRGEGVDPPAMPTHGLIGALGDYMDSPLGYTTRVLATGNDVTSARFLWINTLFVFDAEMVHRVLVANAANYTKGTRGFRKLKLLLGEGLLTSAGDTWRRQRRTAQPAFRRRTIEALGETMVDVSVAHAERLLVDARRAPGGRARVDMAREMNRLTLRIAADTLFGIEIGADGERVGAALTTALDHFHWLVPFPLPYPEYLPTLGNLRFWRAIATLDRITGRIIEARRAELAAGAAPRADLLGLLMAARDPESGEAMSDGQLRDEVITMMLAGHETTANALTFTLMLLAEHGDVAARVIDEIDRVVGTRRPGVADLGRLPLLRQVLLESLRLYPPAWTLVRRAVAADKLGPYRVRPGDYIYTPPFAMHRNPRYWDEPEAFRPERFAEGSEEAARRPKLAFMPFGYGQRKCIGDHFAQMEAMLALVCLLQHVQLEPRGAAGGSDAAARPQPVELEPSVTLRPKGGLPLTITPRRR